MEVFTSATTKSQMHERPSKNIRNIPLHSSLADASQMLHMQFLLYLGDSHGQQFTSTNITRRITGSSIRCPNLTVNKGGFSQVCQNVLQSHSNAEKDHSTDSAVPCPDVQEFCDCTDAS